MSPSRTLLIVLLTIIMHLTAGADLRSGDLIFTGGGTSDFSRAITDATAPTDSLKINHVAIVCVGADTTVIEASPAFGVREISLRSFLDQTPRGADGQPLAIVMRVTANAGVDVDASIDRARQLIGKQYDWYFLPDNDLYYCSELVYECFRTPDGKKIFTAAPMNFKDTDGNFPEFWIKLYENLGMDVPQGIPGTNPADMSKDPVLLPVRQ